jgi:hypothetical protein
MYRFIHLSSGRTGLIAATRLRPALYATLSVDSMIGLALAKAAYAAIGFFVIHLRQKTANCQQPTDD